MGSKTSISTNTGAHLELLRKHVSSHNVLLYTKTTCSYCYEAKSLFDRGKVEYTEYALDKVEGGNSLKKALYELTGQRTVPNIFINQRHIGGYDNLLKLYESGQLKQMLDKANIKNTIVF